MREKNNYIRAQNKTYALYLMIILSYQISGGPLPHNPYNTGTPIGRRPNVAEREFATPQTHSFTTPQHGASAASSGLSCPVKRPMSSISAHVPGQV
jgi:hypothetical protein